MQALTTILFSLISFLASAQITFDLNGKINKKISSDLTEGAEVKLLKIYPANGAEMPMVIVEQDGQQETINLRNLQNITFNPSNIKEFWQDLGLKNGVYENIAKQGLQYSLRSELEDEALEFVDYVENNDLGFNDAYLESYLHALVYRIYPLKLDDGRPGTLNVRVIKDFKPNAYILPNGSLFVTTGMLSTIGSEEELIGILAHEVAHFVLDHSVININEAVQRQKRAEFWAAFATVAAAAVDVYTSANGSNPAPGALTAGTAILSFGIAETIRERMGLKFSREQEMQADDAAVELMKYIRVDPRALASTLSKIKTYSILSGNYLALTGAGTHPAIESRIQKIGEPPAFSNPEYDKTISFVNTFNAAAEFRKKHYQATTNLCQRNIDADLATEEDYVLLAMTKMSMYDSDIRNLEALNLIRKAKGLNVYPTMNIYKQEAIVLIRLTQLDEAKKSLNKYLEMLNTEKTNLNAIKNERQFTNGTHFLEEEREWTLKMINKVEKWK